MRNGRNLPTWPMGCGLRTFKLHFNAADGTVGLSNTLGVMRGNWAPLHSTHRQRIDRHGKRDPLSCLGQRALGRNLPNGPVHEKRGR